MYFFIDSDDCTPNPCVNGGSCTDQVNNYLCQCPPGYNGVNCQTNIGTCIMKIRV